MGSSALITFLITQAPGLIALASRLIDQGRAKATAEEIADAGLADDRFIRAYLRLYGTAPGGGVTPKPTPVDVGRPVPAYYPPRT